MNYSAKIIAKIRHGEGYWNTLKVGIFCNHEQIGIYERNYSPRYNTFFPFEKDSKWYALYSPSYSATRLMRLPSCEDIGGEEKASNGFCPVDYFVPRYIKWHCKCKGGSEFDLVHNDPSEKYIKDVLAGEQRKDYSNIRQGFYNFGFVAGCVWGDDTSWKIQYLDLSQADKGILVRDHRFGYIEMPESMKLSEAINMENYDPDNKVDWMSISVQKRYKLSKDSAELHE